MGTAKVSKLDGIAEDIFMGMNFARIEKGATKKVTVPIIHVKDLVNGNIRSKERLEHERIPEGVKLDRQLLKSGDIIVSARGTLLKCSVVQSHHTGCVASANFIVIRPGEKPRLHPELIGAALRHADIREALLNRASGSVQPKLTIRDLETVSVEVPTKDMQEKLVRLIKSSDKTNKVAIELAYLRDEETLSIIAEHMGLKNGR